MSIEQILKCYTDAAASLGYTLSEDSKKRLTKKANETLSNWKETFSKPIVSAEDSIEFTGQIIDILEDELSKENDDIVLITTHDYDAISKAVTQAILSDKY